MLYAIRWYDKFHRTYEITTGASIPDALHRGQMRSGANFIFSDKLYGIMDIDNEFVRVPELDEPGRFTPKELDERLKRYYHVGGSLNEDSGG